MKISVCFCITEVAKRYFFCYTKKMKTKFKNSTLLFWHRLLRGIANSAIELFIPLIIYTKTNNIYFALLFSLAQAVFATLGFLFGRKGIRKFPVFFIILSLVPTVVSYFLLNVEINLFMVLLLGALGGVSWVFYYGAVNLVFAVMDEKTDSAKFDAGSNLGKILFTILSAYVLGSVKNSLIFVVIFSCVLHIVSIFPLLVNYKQFKNIIGDIPKNNQLEVVKDTKWYNLYHLTMGAFSFFAETFLPLYLAINGLSFSAVGIFMAAGQVLRIVGCYCAKFMQVKKWDIVWIVVCALLFLCPVIVIMFSKNNVVIYIMNLLITLSFSSIHTLLFNWFCKNQKRNDFVYDSMYYRDVFQNSGRIIAIGFFSLIIASAFWIGIGTSILNGVFGTLAVKKSKKDEISNSENS